MSDHAGHVARMQRELRALEAAIANQEHRFADLSSGALTHLTEGASRLCHDIEIAVSEADALEETQEQDVQGIGAAYDGEDEAQRERV